MRKRALAFVCLLGVAACGPSVHGGNGNGDDSSGEPDAASVPDGSHGTQTCQKMDILFIVDDSPSMDQEQANLAANFPMFASILDAYRVDGNLPLDYHIGITTTGVTKAFTESTPPIGPIPATHIPMSQSGDDGAMRETCGMSKRWLERTDADVPGTFACAANVGVDGPSDEMPLYGAELALSARLDDGTNGAFLRDDALLAVVYLTDEDDCSRHDDNFDILVGQPCTSELPQQYVDFLDQLKGGRDRWAAAVFAAPQDCTSDFGDAVAAPRLVQFVQLAGTHAVFSSICDADLAGGLQAAISTFTAACESFPLPG